MQNENQQPAGLGLGEELGPCGTVLAVNVCGEPMPNSSGVEWLRPVALGSKLYDQAALDNEVAAERERCLRLLFQGGAQRSAVYGDWAPVSEAIARGLRA